MANGCVSEVPIDLTARCGFKTNWRKRHQSKTGANHLTMEHDIKSIRKKFKENGVFYTGEKLSLFLKSFLPDDIIEVYDPTCGGGNLLSVFTDEVAKYGQELDEQQAKECADRLNNATIMTGDTLITPHFADRRFKAIVANPPFSVKYSPDECYRFTDWPNVMPPPSKADYAFLLHIWSMLDDGGVAVTVNFPGILYRGQREGQIREWLVRQNAIERVMLMKGNYEYFVDTSISTALVVLRKGRASTSIIFADEEQNIEREVPFEEVEKNGFVLSPSSYVQPPEPEKPPVDPRMLESKARQGVLRTIRAQLNFSLAVAEMEGWSIEPFLDEIHDVINEFRQQPTLF